MGLLSWLLFAVLAVATARLAWRRRPRDGLAVGLVLVVAALAVVLLPGRVRPVLLSGPNEALLGMGLAIAAVLILVADPALTPMLRRLRPRQSASAPITWLVAGGAMLLIGAGATGILTEGSNAIGPDPVGVLGLIVLAAGVSYVVMAVVVAARSRRARADSRVIEAALAGLDATDPCAGELPQALRNVIVGCPGDGARIVGDATVRVPDRWVALDATRASVQELYLRLGSGEGSLALPGDVDWRVVICQLGWTAQTGPGLILLATCDVAEADVWMRAAMAGHPFPSDVTVSQDHVSSGPCPMDRMLVYGPDKHVGNVVYERGVIGIWMGRCGDVGLGATVFIPGYVDGDLTMLDEILGAPIAS